MGDAVAKRSIEPGAGGALGAAGRVASRVRGVESPDVRKRMKSIPGIAAWVMVANRPLCRPDAWDVRMPDIFGDTGTPSVMKVDPASARWA